MNINYNSIHTIDFFERLENDFVAVVTHAPPTCEQPLNNLPSHNLYLTVPTTLASLACRRHLGLRPRFTCVLFIHSTGISFARRAEFHPTSICAQPLGFLKSIFNSIFSLLLRRNTAFNRFTSNISFQLMVKIYVSIKMFDSCFRVIYFHRTIII